MQFRSSSSGLAASLACFLLAASSAAQLKPLDHSVYDSWKSIQGRTMSADGKWIAYAINPQEGDGVAEAKPLQGAGAALQIERGGGLRFTADSKFLLATQAPKFLEARQARRDRRPPAQQPKSNLVIADLAAGKQTVVEKVASWTMAQEDQGWILYRPEPAPAPAAPGGAAPGGPRPAAPAPDEALSGEDQAPPATPAASGEVKKKADHAAGSLHILRHLASGTEVKIEDAASAAWSRNGSTLIAAISTKDGKGDGLVLFNLSGSTAARKEIVSGMGRYQTLTLSRDGQLAAFTTDKDDYAAKTPRPSLYTWSAKTGKLAKVEGIPEGMWAASAYPMGFSWNASRLQFGIRPRPEEDPAPVPEDERVTLDIWHWQEDVLTPAQLRTAEAERNRAFSAILDMATGKVTPLEDKDLPTVQLADRGDGPVGLGFSNMPYRKMVSWAEGLIDVYLVDPGTGARRKVIEGLNGFASLSPTGKWVIGYDDKARTLFSIDPMTGRSTVLNKDLPVLFNELQDVPALDSPYGVGGWVEGENAFLVYDRYDIWMVDPSGKAAPVNVTAGLGRRMETVFRLVNLDPEERHVPQTFLLSAASERTKEEGYYSGSLKATKPVELIGGPKMVDMVMKAKDADVITFRQQRFEVFPDIWTSRMDFASPVRLTDANPQQKEYLWGTSELVEWISNDGEKLQGILIKPGGFDPNKRYPMITYFYERESDRLFSYSTPAPSASTINLALFASQGYVIFIPDIPYKEGYPGESAVSAILPGVQKVVGMGFVDPARLGLQGQSWGGYQTVYLITETDMFAAACAGAPVSNMFSAYGGIRYGSGLVRQMQYEIGQSRIGKSMWESPMRYYENSPIFFADKVQTPLFIMSNDQDGAVPWTEGIQLFTALRRLNRPAWMINYNGEDHNLMQRRNRKDFSVRLSQFFDHYLKGAPMPVWMATGIPAVQKGRTMGLDLTKPKP